MLPLTTFTHEFEGEPLVTLTYDGRPAWVARHIGARLGYSHGGKRLPNKILGEWADEFIEGQDYAFLTGEELEAFKGLAAGGPGEVPANTRRGLLILFETGLHLALVKTQRPIGKRLRRFLVDQVLPQLVRTGAYQPTPSVPETAIVLVTLPPPRPTLSERRELRLARQADTRERWVDLLDRRLKVQTLHRTVDRLQGTPLLPNDVAATLEVTAAEIALDADLAVLMPETRRWVSPGQIARRWAVSKERVGRVITMLGLRGNEAFSRRVMRRYGKTESGEPRRVFSWVYNAAAEALIEETLDSLGYAPQDAA